MLVVVLCTLMRLCSKRVCEGRMKYKYNSHTVHLLCHLHNHTCLRSLPQYTQVHSQWCPGSPSPPLTQWHSGSPHSPCLPLQVDLVPHIQLNGVVSEGAEVSDVVLGGGGISTEGHLISVWGPLVQNAHSEAGYGAEASEGWVLPLDATLVACGINSYSFRCQTDTFHFSVWVLRLKTLPSHCTPWAIVMLH